MGPKCAPRIMDYINLLGCAKWPFFSTRYAFLYLSRYSCTYGETRVLLNLEVSRVAGLAIPRSPTILCQPNTSDFVFRNINARDDSPGRVIFCDRNNNKIKTPVSVVFNFN